jgi:hypothetical protein
MYNKSICYNLFLTNFFAKLPNFFAILRHFFCIFVKKMPYLQKNRVYYQQCAISLFKINAGANVSQNVPCVVAHINSTRPVFFEAA